MKKKRKSVWGETNEEGDFPLDNLKNIYVLIPMLLFVLTVIYIIAKMRGWGI